MTRRRFIYHSALAAGAILVPLPAGTLRARSPGDKLNIAVIGAGGKGAGDTDEVAGLGENIYALCDVDENTLKSRGQKYPKARQYRDYRKMLDAIGGNIDAVIVSTPDHHHALAASLAMNMGKHVYVQKPLTHSIYEARHLRDLAGRKAVATQMGNQGSAGDGLRRAVEVIQAGVIGQAQELHVWSNRPLWPQGIDRPDGEDAIPAALDWDGWIGPAPLRPYKANTYHRFAWRGWKDFGSGALGDMACHTVNMPFRALRLGYPTVVECEETSERHAETYPKTSRIRFEFPAREGLAPLKFWWYDGNPKDKAVTPLRPNEQVTREVAAMRGGLPESGCLVIGDKGRLFSPDDYGSRFYLMMKGERAFAPAKRTVNNQELEHEALRHIPQTIPRLGPGNGDVHQKKEWLEAIRGGRPPYSNFAIAAYLTEIILLGCVAMRVGVGKRLDWDGPNMQARNAPEAAQFVRREYRAGWKL
jgi:predicted dehydrogenase